jgi:hypothetical protein
MEDDVVLQEGRRINKPTASVRDRRRKEIIGGIREWSFASKCERDRDLCVIDGTMSTDC